MKGYGLQLRGTKESNQERGGWLCLSILYSIKYVMDAIGTWIWSYAGWRKKTWTWGSSKRPISRMKSTCKTCWYTTLGNWYTQSEQLISGVILLWIISLSGESAQSFGFSVVSFHMASGGKRWYVVGCYIAPTGTTTMKQLSKFIGQRPNGDEIFLAGNLSVYIWDLRQE